MHGLGGWDDSPTRQLYAPPDLPPRETETHDTQQWRTANSRRRGSPGRSSRRGGHSPMRNRAERPCCIYLHYNGEVVEPRQGYGPPFQWSGSSNAVAHAMAHADRPGCCCHRRTKLIVKLSALKDFHELTDEVTAKLKLPRRAKKLFRADGAEITSLSDISDGSLDVVVATSNFFLPPVRMPLQPSLPSLPADPT